MNNNNYIHSELTGLIIECYFYVYNELGCGFLEKVYENAMVIALQNKGLMVERQKQTMVFFDGQIVGEYYPDIIVNEMVVVELKACKELISAHVAQLINYLKATGIEVGIIFNFGPKPEFKRRVFSNRN